MRIIYFVLFGCLFISTTFSQEQVFESDKLFSKSHPKKNESVALSNQKNGDVMMISFEKEIVRSFLLDNKYQLKSEISTEEFPRKYKKFLAYSVYDDNYTILCSNNSGKKFGLLRFNTNDQNFDIREIKISLKKEQLLDFLVYNNAIFLFSISEKSPELYIYKYDANFIPKKHSVSLKDVEFPSIPGSKILIKTQSQFRGTRAAGNPSDKKGAYTKIDNNYPNLIEATSKKVKLYVNDNKAIFTFDRNPEQTDLIAINLDTFEESHKSFEKASKDRKKFKQHNSYLLEDKLFQIASGPNELDFRVTNIETNHVYKVHTVKKEDTISFKNSPIIFEKTGKNKIFIAPIDIDKTKSIEKTKKFLSKLTAMRLGVAVHKADNKYVVTIGGTTEYDPNAIFKAALLAAGGIAGAAASGSIATVPTGPENPFYFNHNPVHHNYYHYHSTTSATARKTVYIDCLFDKNLNHTAGEIPENEFDRLSKFEESLEHPEAVHIFTHNDKLHYGFYEKESGLYKIYNLAR